MQFSKQSRTTENLVDGKHTQPKHNSISTPIFTFIVLFLVPPSTHMKLIYNPGAFNTCCYAEKYESGFEGSHTRYTLGKKLSIISVVEKLRQEEQLSLSEAAVHVQIDPTMISRWLKRLRISMEIPRRHPRWQFMLTIQALFNIKQDLLAFIVEWCQKGFKVNRFTLLRKAGQLKPELFEHSKPTHKIDISCFPAKNNLMHHVSTHKAQCNP
jgi:hypothetical protein